MDKKKLEALIEKIIALCREEGVSLSHEDYHGGFQFEGPSEYNEKWLRQAEFKAPVPEEPKKKWRCPYCSYVKMAYVQPSCRNCTWRPMLEEVLIEGQEHANRNQAEQPSRQAKDGH